MQVDGRKQTQIGHSRMTGYCAFMASPALSCINGVGRH